MPHQSRDSIIRQASQLFIKRGFNGVSMSQIANACGLNKATLYHHFVSKEQLYLQAVQAVSVDILTQFSQAPQDGEWEERLEAAAVNLAKIIAERGLDTVMLIRDLDRFTPEVGASWREQIGDIALAPLVSTIQAGIDAGALAIADPVFAAWMLTAMVTVAARPLMRQPDLAQVHRAVAFFLNGARIRNGK
ncbi:MAG: TetR/AcrR family transcriptional regulator [Anaerolineae bacterium]